MCRRRKVARSRRGTSDNSNGADSSCTPARSAITEASIDKRVQTSVRLRFTSPHPSKFASHSFAPFLCPHPCALPQKHQRPKFRSCDNFPNLVTGPLPRYINLNCDDLRLALPRRSNIQQQQFKKKYLGLFKRTKKKEIHTHFFL